MNVGRSDGSPCGVSGQEERYGDADYPKVRCSKPRQQTAGRQQTRRIGATVASVETAGRVPKRAGRGRPRRLFSKPFDRETSGLKRRVAYAEIAGWLGLVTNDPRDVEAVLAEAGLGLGEAVFDELRRALEATAPGERRFTRHVRVVLRQLIERAEALLASQDGPRFRAPRLLAFRLMTLGPVGETPLSEHRTIAAVVGPVAEVRGYRRLATLTRAITNALRTRRVE